MPLLIHMPGIMITKEHTGIAGVFPHFLLNYQNQIRLSSIPEDGRTPGVSAHTIDCVSACLSQAQNRHSPATCNGRTPGVPAHACDCLCACQDQTEHDLVCLVKLPGSSHLQSLCSHIGTSGGYGHKTHSQRVRVDSLGLHPPRRCLSAISGCQAVPGWQTAAWLRRRQHRAGSRYVQWACAM